MKPSLALSTCWNSFRHSDGYAMLQEIADLGFEYAELSHGIRVILIPGILRAVEAGVVKIASTHNFCPLPAGVNHAAPNLFEPSSQDYRERAQWLRHTKRSIAFAQQVGAGVIVTHLGSVRFFWRSPAKKLKAYLETHPDAPGGSDPKYQTLLRKACEKLRKKMPPSWQQVLANLDEVRAYALENSVQIACENRERFEELPVDIDFEDLFSSLTAPHPCGYWHDAGHAEIKRSMGLIEPETQLERYASQLLGFHLHDVDARGRDHQPIGSGHIDFEAISKFWQPHHRLTIELNPRVAAKDVLASRERVEALIERRFAPALSV